MIQLAEKTKQNVENANGNVHTPNTFGTPHYLYTTNKGREREIKHNAKQMLKRIRKRNGRANGQPQQ